LCSSSALARSYPLSAFRSKAIVAYWASPSRSAAFSSGSTGSLHRDRDEDALPQQPADQEESVVVVQPG
jgi:hypothetical protein